MEGIRRPLSRALKYLGYDPDPVNTSDDSIYFLGKEYESCRTRDAADGPDKDSKAKSDSRQAADSWPSDFMNDYRSRIFLCYRRDFPLIARERTAGESSYRFASSLRLFGDRTGFTSDTGWGCMIRTSQMLLANTLLILQHGRDWRINSAGSEPTEAEIIRLFADDPQGPFSIHRILCHAYQGLGMRVYVTTDSPDIYQDELLETAGSPFEPTLILVCTRLGIQAVNPVYHESILDCLRRPQSVGIAGGRPDSSHYFCGSQGRELFYLDPHSTEPLIPFVQPEAALDRAHVESCHCTKLNRMSIVQLDPSMLIGFLIRNMDEWTDFKHQNGLQQQSKGQAIRILDTRHPIHATSDPTHIQDIISDISDQEHDE